MKDEVSECIDLITHKIVIEENKWKSLGLTPKTQSKVLPGLEVARAILTQYWEENR